MPDNRTELYLSRDSADNLADAFDRPRRWADCVPPRSGGGWFGPLAGIILVVALVAAFVGTMANNGAFTCNADCWAAKTAIGVAQANASSDNMGTTVDDKKIGVAMKAPPVPATQPLVLFQPPAGSPAYVAPVNAPPVSSPNHGSATWDQICICLKNLGLVDGDFFSRPGPDGLPHAILTDAAAAKLRAEGKLDQAAGCLH